MVKQVVQYETSDGKKFNSEVEAQGHEVSLENRPLIEAYIKAADLKVEGAQAGFLRKHLAGFIAFDADPKRDERVEAMVAELKERDAAEAAAKEAEKAEKKAAEAANESQAQAAA